MGCGESVPDDIPSKPTSIKTSASKQEITIAIKVTGGKFDEANLRIIFLGPGDTGKSTFASQIDSIYNSIDSSIIDEYAKQIKQIIILDAKAVIEQVEKNGQQVSDKLQKGVISLKESAVNPEALTESLATTISDLWNDPTFKTAFGQISNRLHENVEEFFIKATEIAKSDFKPTFEQIFKASIPTKGYRTHQIKINQYNTEIVEIGGEKTERENWHHAYKDVDLIVYVASLSDFNQTMTNEPDTQRTQDALSLFSQIAANPLFATTPIFLLLNKSDVFGRKLAKDFEAFKRAYPGFSGDSSQVQEAISHVKEAYMRQLDKDRPKEAWVEVEDLVALDDEAVKKVVKKIATAAFKLGDKAKPKSCLKEQTKVEAEKIVYETHDDKDDMMVEAAPFEEAVKETVVVKKKAEPTPPSSNPLSGNSSQENLTAPPVAQRAKDKNSDDSDSDSDSLSDSGSSLSTGSDESSLSSGSD